MLFFVRTTKGKGDTGVYARLKNPTGQYWDFTALTWVSVENANCKLLLFEYADSDTQESLYMSEAPIPAGGPWIEEAVHVSDGEVVAFDNNVMGELQSIPDVGSSLQEKLEFIFQYLAGKRTATSALETMLKTDNTVLGTATLSDDGTTFTKNKVV